MRNYLSRSCAALRRGRGWECARGHPVLSASQLAWRSARPFLLCLGWALASRSASAGHPGNAARQFTEHAEQLSAQGAFAPAVDEWKRARDAWRKARDASAGLEAELQLAAAYRGLGQQRRALETLEGALAAARTQQDRAHTVAALSGLGGALTYSRQPERAEQCLHEALALARSGGEASEMAAVLGNLATFDAAQGREAAALAGYREALGLAVKAGDSPLVAAERTNLAAAMVRAGSYEAAAALNAEALRETAALAPSHRQLFCQLRAGQTWERIFEGEPAHDPARRVAALHAYEDAARRAEALGDERALSLALGYAGHLYEQEKKLDEARRLTSRAAFLAQRLQSPDLLYQWEWQTGRLLRAAGRSEEATAACRRAVELLETIRTDLSARLAAAPGHASFREAVGGAYFELADLLLLRADSLSAPAEVEKTLLQAREICEQLKAVELEDYFQDDCVNLVRKKQANVEDLLRAAVKPGAGRKATAPASPLLEKTALIYFIPLPDRTETLISLPDGLQRLHTPVTAEQLTAVARDFRYHLEKRTTNEYLTEARQLHEWLIRPLETLLGERHIETLVFVPDGALRTVPMAAFYDGEKFLVEKYAVAVSPGLTLMEPKRMSSERPAVMASGLSEAVQGYAALPHVAEEMQDLQRFHGRTLLNRDFSVSNVQKEFKDREYSVVHLASHGEFSGDVRKTFVLTYDDRLSLDMLERLIRPAQLRAQPVELLTLSACQTAAGDDRAALGLAGVAVKAGARSAFATLWFVNDEASTALIGDFYGALFGPAHPTKAQALRGAQLKLLADARYSHPCLWAPYLIIGNWL